MSWQKSRPKCSPTHVLSKVTHNLTVEKYSPKIWATSVIFKKMYKYSNRPIRENSPNLVTVVETSTKTRVNFQAAPFDIFCGSKSQHICCSGFNSLDANQYIDDGKYLPSS
jgi:hypothetical protein